MEQGPYTNRGPVLVGGEPGQWDHTQYSESKVAYREGVFHLFFSAGRTPPGDPDPGSLTAKRHQARGGGGGGGRRSERRRLGDAWETTGYAFSFDGLHFDRNINNPVMRRQADPNVHRNSEPHIFMPGGNLLYVYHTMRFSDLRDHAGEDIGVEVLSHTPSFRLPMPVTTLPLALPFPLYAVCRLSSACRKSRQFHLVCASVRVRACASEGRLWIA